MVIWVKVGTWGVGDLWMGKRSGGGIDGVDVELGMDVVDRIG